eukprot:6212109-Pleurochrysis_carterae.AAC.4
MGQSQQHQSQQRGEHRKAEVRYKTRRTVVPKLLSPKRDGRAEGNHVEEDRQHCTGGQLAWVLRRLVFSRNVRVRLRAARLGWPIDGWGRIRRWRALFTRGNRLWMRRRLCTGAIGEGCRGRAGLCVVVRGVNPCPLSGDVPGARECIHFRPWQGDGNAFASIVRGLRCGCTSRSRRTHASVRSKDESSSASIAASSESTSSQGWNGWSGSEDLPMRRAHAAPWSRSARFMTPLPSGAGGEACAIRECGRSIDFASLGVGIALGSASEACRHSALPAASKVKGISPPSCTKSALSAVSETGVSSALNSEDSEAASFARDSLLR